MKKHITILLGMGIFLASCVNEKYVYKCNTLYKIETTTPNSDASDVIPPSVHTLKVLTLNEGFKAIIKDKDDYLTIKPIENQRLPSTDIILSSAPTYWRAEIEGKIYFPEQDLDTNPHHPVKLKYFDTKPVLQGLTIPLKIRPKLKEFNSKSLLDSFPQQAESGFNVGVAFGWKLTHNIYNANKNIFSQNTNKYSITPGWYLGTGAVDLKKANTRDPIKFERKAAIITTGGFLMIGFNTINLGYSFGWDFATGTGKEQWVYKGKLWHGVVFAIDIIK